MLVDATLDKLFQSSENLDLLEGRSLDWEGGLVENRRRLILDSFHSFVDQPEYVSYAELVPRIN